MKNIYCDNSSTSFPKAPGLGRIMGEHIDNNGYNISRGSYENAYRIEEKVLETREFICEMFGADNFINTRNVVFTAGATAGHNMLLKGILRPGDRLVTSSMEHNAVVRPAWQLTSEGTITWDTVQCNDKGILDISNLEASLNRETRLVAVTHASNVCGTILPIEEIGKVCRKKGIMFAVDASQTAGSVEIDMERSFIDVLIFPGHKALLGPQGIGVMMVGNDAAKAMRPLLLGGTGSSSDKEIMPEFLPDKFQPGTLNIPGIIGLNHALSFIKREGPATIKEKKEYLTNLFLNDVMNIDNVRLVGLESTEGRCAVLSLDFMDKDNSEISYTLENEYGIMTRCGLHCAPHAHKTLGTFPQGTVRFSFGYFNTEEEVKKVVDCINRLSCV